MFDTQISSKIKKNILDLILETLSQKDFSSLDFLCAITLDLKLNRTPSKNHIRSIKKCLKQVQKRFDNIYLLIYSLDNNRKVFHESENRFLLDFGYDLINILNFEEYIKEADILNDILSKLELGYERYFIQGNLTVDKFCPSEYIYEIQDVSNEINFKAKLNLSLKNKKEFKQIQNYIKYFPEKIYSKKTQYLLDIEKSLFPKENLDLLDFKKEKVILQDLNSFKIILKILELIDKK